MSNQSQEMLNTALQLPEAERAWLAERLLDSLPPDAETIGDDSFLDELQRREAEADRDPSVMTPWSEVRRMT